MSELRIWQDEALRKMVTWTSTRDNGFLVEATPGAGKTRFAIEVARRYLEAGRVGRVIVVVPTARLESQWAEAFHEAGVNINPKWHAQFGALAADEQGVAATYGEVAFNPPAYRYLAAQVPAIVILDEVHHCGDERAWGDGVRSAFEPAVCRLLLSGTPFRSDNNAIPFVNYVDGKGVPDYIYGYGEALRDGVVRSIFFPRRGGTMEWTGNDGQLHQHDFDDELAHEDAQHRLRTAISGAGEWLPTVLQDANTRLLQLRADDPSAGGIVFADHVRAAEQIGGMLQARGIPAVVATSDQIEADELIRRFRDSTDPWIVTVRKVSEGVDIPRLRVGVYATARLTELFFRQVVGRMVRVRPGEEDPVGFLYIPDDPRLRGMAQQIKMAREHALNDRDEDLLRDRGDGEGSGTSDGTLPLGLFVPISAGAAEDRGVIADDATISPAELARAEQMKKLSEQTRTLSTEQVAILLRNAAQLGVIMTTQTPEAGARPAAVTKMQVDRKKELRTANNTMVARISNNHGAEHAHVNATLNAAVGVRRIQQATEEQLEKRLGLAQEWLTSGYPPAGA